MLYYDLCMLVIMQSVMYCEVTQIFFVYIVSCSSFSFATLKGKICCQVSMKENLYSSWVVDDRL